MPAVLLFLLPSIVCVLTQSVLALCPPQCECKWKSGKESVICLNANLSAVPLHLDAGTQVLDLTGNGLVSLRHEEFSKAGLVNLQKVHLAKCRLKTIERYSFKHLINLVELDLSNNLLSNIPSHTFDSITELRELRLNGNPIMKIFNDAFLHLTQLTRLELSDCRVSLIEPRAFAGLERSLEWLKLDQNKLVEAEVTSFENFQSLHGLELANNPWNCTCSILPLRMWMVRQNVPFGVPPMCHSPKRLHMKPWDRLSLDEYACAPSIITIRPVVYGTETNNVTLQCRTSGIPAPEVRWSFKNKVIANLSTPYAGSSKLYVMVISNHTSDLRIYSVDIHDAGPYVCAAENKAGKAEASIQLHVSKKPPDGTLTNKMLIASVMTGVALVLVLCLVFLCLFSVRKKQVFKWRNRDCAREDNYEKIEMNHKSAKANGGVNINQDKNGEYRVIPGIETDQDAEEEEESNVDSVSSKKWNSSKSLEKASLDHILDPEDLHIPRRTIQVTRDNTTKASISTYGTYNQPPQPSQLHQQQLHYSPTSSTASSGTTSPYHHPASSFRRYIPTTSYTPTKELTRVAEDLEIQQRTLPRTQKEHQDLGRYKQDHKNAEKDHQDIPRVHQDPSKYQQATTRNYPDLIERSPSSAHFRTYRGYGGGSRAASETSGSMQDINEIFCTLPRKKDLIRGSRYNSSDSQAPLLPDSRYASSSGGESYLGSQDNDHRRMSDSQRYPAAIASLNRSRLNKVSGSFHNLARDEYVSTKEVPAEMNATPLLDVSALESRLLAGKRDLPPLPSTSDGGSSKAVYDYHAAQLERFLEEYRALQKELTKMKETCQETASEEGQQEVVVSPSSLEESEDFKHFENELTKYLISEKLSPSITSDLLKS